VNPIFLIRDKLF